MSNELKGLVCVDGFLSDHERACLKTSLPDLYRRAPLVYHWMSMPIDPIEDTPIQTLIQRVAARIPCIGHYVGVEFWSVILNAGEYVDWHVDKDEYLFWARTGPVKTPDISAIVYVHDAPLRGGGLEPAGQHVIEAVPGRLVLMPGSLTHRVLPIVSGRRESVVMNFWSCVPLAYR